MWLSCGPLAIHLEFDAIFRFANEVLFGEETVGQTQEKLERLCHLD